MASQTKMQSWIDLQSTILDEIISLDGLGEAQQDTCGSCLSRESTPLYRCLECSYGLLVCGDCVVKSHKVLPLHRLEVCFLLRPLLIILTSFVALEGWFL